MDSGFNLVRILLFCEDEEKMIKYFMQRGVLKNTMNCPKCDGQMKRVNSFWRCWKLIKGKKGKHQCQGVVSIRHKSWFAKSKLPMKTIMAVTYMMLYNYERQAIAWELDVNLETITNWLGFLREVNIPTTIRTKPQEGERAALGA